VNTDVRVEHAREYLGYARKVTVADLPPSPLMRLAAELRRQLGQVLDVVGEREAVDQVLSAALTVGADDAGRLAGIRAVLDEVLHDELADREHALEQIELIAGDSGLPVTAGEGSAPGDSRRALLAAALADAIAFREARAAMACDDCEASESGACSRHLDEIDQADRYRIVGRELGIGVDR
jgi:hypothetical protein